MNHLYAFALLLAIPLVFAAARYLKDLDDAIPAWLVRSLLTGMGGGIAAFLIGPWLRPELTAIVPGVLVGTAVILVSRRAGEHDVFDGILTGGVVAVGFGLPLILGAHAPLRVLIALFLSGVVSGAVAAALIGRSTPAAATQGVTLIAALAAALAGQRVPEVADPLTVVSTLAALVALTAAGSVFWRSWAVASELREEAALGLLDTTLAARIAHPVRRMIPRGMSAEANRKVVRLAWALALEKRRQRSLDERQARLRQLEVMKLRMQLAETLRVIREIEFLSDAGRAGDGAGPSDTIAVKG
ncbi:MAG: hypothetical protein ABR517_04110 [Thermoanaerobaculia bacterium]